MNESWYRLGMILTASVGIWEGLMAIIFKAFTDKGPSVMTAVNYLPSPWCYVAGVGVMVAAFGVIALLDLKHKRVLAGR